MRHLTWQLTEQAETTARQDNVGKILAICAMHVLSGQVFRESVFKACPGWPRLHVINNVCMTSAGLPL